MTKEEQSETSGVSRRDLIEKGAATSGAVFIGGAALTSSAAADHATGSHQQDEVTVTCDEDCLVVVYDFRGLGNFRGTAELTAEGTVVGTCTNSGGNQAPGQNPARVTADDEQTVQGRQGRVQNEDDPVELCPEEIEDENTCPNENWTFTPTEPVKWESVDIVLIDQQGTVVRHETLPVEC